MELFLPLIGVVIGWGLHELSSWLRLRREDRKAYGGPLASALAIFRRLLVARQLTEYMNERFSSESSDSMFSENKATAGNLLRPVSWRKLVTSLEESAHRLRGTDPIMALHIINILPVLESLPDDPSKNEGSDPSSRSTVDSTPIVDHSEHATIHTASVALLLAKRHGLITYFRTRQFLKEPAVVASEADEAFDRLEDWEEMQAEKRAFRRFARGSL